MPLSSKQLDVLRFPYAGKTALICDGAVRSGKTSVMSISFILWAMSAFSGQSFAFCSRSVGAAERNIIKPLLEVQYLSQQFDLKYNRAEHMLTVKRGEKTNRFYLFGGKDESSYTLIQGVTLAGVLLDEVALMPRSFVDQALARCSVEGARLWFSCNPEGPKHWFREEWLLKLAEKDAMHIHFAMDDNPGLSEETKERYRRQYSGVFYQRYILGRWVMSEGLIYDMFDETANTYRPEDRPVGLYSVAQRTIAVDYGTANPTVFLDIWDDGEAIRVDREYYWDSRKEYRQKTDAEYADDLLAFMGDSPCAVIVDPSAASFIAELRSRGAYVVPANNEVLDGIRRASSLMQQRTLLVCTDCGNLLGELSEYMWDDKAAARGEDRPVKQSDHCADALRYYINALPEWRCLLQ